MTWLFYYTLEFVCSFYNFNNFIFIFLSKCKVISIFFFVICNVRLTVAMWRRILWRLEVLWSVFIMRISSEKNEEIKFISWRFRSLDIWSAFLYGLHCGRFNQMKTNFMHAIFCDDFKGISLSFARFLRRVKIKFHLSFDLNFFYFKGNCWKCEKTPTKKNKPQTKKSE